MNKNLLLIFSLVLVHLSFFAQTSTVYYDVVQNTLNEGSPLPAETPFQLRSNLPENVVFVEVDIHRGEQRGNPDFSYSWKKPFNFEVNEWGLKVADPLRGNDNYTFVFKYFVKAGQNQMQRLEAGVHKNLEAYINANFEVRRRSFSVMSGKREMMKNLNKIMCDGVNNYRHGTDAKFEGFSDIVAQKIDQIEGANLKRARFNVFGSRKNKDSTRVNYAKQLIDELVSLVKGEASQYLNSDMFVLADTRLIQNQATENTPNYIALNFGYAGAPLGGGFSNLDYDVSPYAGISIPLGKLAFHPFLSKTSFSAGLMTQNMNDNDGNLISGPLVGRPLYAALGFKTLKIFRFNAGAMVASQEVTNMNNQVSENIKIYPFVGIALELNMWLGFNRK